MTKKNKLCYKEVKDHNILNTYYKAISNLCFINCNGGASIVKAGWDIETQKGENSIGLHYLYK